ncbi:hypothetical protein CBR_g54809 [Chara braunii]|uniref:Uncharacterized protein n=1 Tax=Chara braunii TaxID=69332 RepID=A0A388JPI0_CHABU|nr:hypothetical protein CBR_g54809 [Chara braunii]|eukprot:GBG59704.1 hypothetical protein CBR_g54809 [Chara braunii]
MPHGGLADIAGNSAAANVDLDFGVHVDDPVLATVAHHDGDIGADMENPVAGTDEDTEAAGGDAFSTPDPGLRLGDRFTSLLHHVAPIVPSASTMDFRRHLAVMPPMRTNSEEQTPDWARFTGPTLPALWLTEDIPPEARA